MHEMHCARRRFLRSGGRCNLLIRGDNRRVLAMLQQGPLRESLDAEGGIKLIYCDPPFSVGADFMMPPLRATAPASERRVKSSGLQALAYRDRWERGLNDFLSMIHERLLLMRGLLAPDGSIYLHCDWRSAPYLRLLMDEVFGHERFLGDIVWHYTGGGRSKRWFARKHDRILHYAASDIWHFNPDAVRVPYKPGSGYAKSGIVSAAGKHYAPHPEGTPVDDVWDIPMVNPLAKERCGYPTQKPEALLERIVKASSRPGDLVADFFCGSGTTCVCAEKLGRSWIGVDDSAHAVHTARKRLLSLGGRGAARPERPFALAVPERPSTAGEPFRHLARLPKQNIPYELTDVRLERQASGGKIRVSLLGFAVRQAHARDEDAAVPADSPESARRAAALFSELLRSHWLDWLDYWSIGILDANPQHAGQGQEPALACARVLWQSFREGNAAPSLDSPALELPEGGSRLAISVVDVFANESRIILTL